MKILVTTSRMPFSLSTIRKLAKAGHEIYACDTFDDAPGSHSRFDAKHFVTAPPRFETRKFIDDLKRLITENSIDLLVPTMEEVFYISYHQEELRELTDVFCSSFESLHTLHHKARFQELCGSLGLRVPQTVVATNMDELKEAINSFEHYIARPSFSRGGFKLLANTGGRAGILKLEDCDPTVENPWLIQEFVTGDDLCSYSIARNGKLASHLCYETPVEVEDAYGIEFLSVDRPEAYEMIKTIVEHLNFHGHISFDFKQTKDGLCLIECNPRCTNGALLLPGEVTSEAITGKGVPSSCFMMPEGEKAQVAFGMVYELFENLKNFPKTLKDFLTIKDAYIDRHDILPAFYAISFIRRFQEEADKRHVGLMDAMLEDVAWDGAAMV
ncbi:MAG: ATP-grasp domain-containing protein [Candidatus Eremiobacteraeota bacterium]|nr:ATP-grasp domain-containing protein [Candidatus Eremiobacteraeota bacterium]